MRIDLEVLCTDFCNKDVEEMSAGCVGIIKNPRCESLIITSAFVVVPVLGFHIKIYGVDCL